MEHQVLFSNSANVAIVIAKDGLLNFPEGLTVLGDLDLEGISALTGLPANLTITGSLLLRGTSLRRIPNKMRVYKNVDLEKCSHLTSIGDDVIIDGDLDIEGCRSVKTIPISLKVGGALFAQGTNIKTIERPENFGAAFI